jgi:hypothetical protein
MVKRIVLLSTVVAVFVWGQTVSVAADTGFTSNDFRVTPVVADIGATATVTVEGTMDRDLYFMYPGGQVGFNVHPSFDLQQTCANLMTPTETIVATRTQLAVCGIQSHGRGATWAKR